MTDDALKETITHIAEPVATSLGLVIWGVEIVRAGRTVVRLFVDVPFSTATDEQPTPAPIDNDDTNAPAMVALSASLGQCEEISRHVALALEVEDTIPEAYVLEVSTPGLTRLFFSLDQMRHYMGDVVEARLLRAVAINEGTPEGPNPSHGGPRRIWRGELLAVEDTSFTLAPATILPEGDVVPEALPPVVIPWEAVRRASRMYIFRQPQKPGKSRAKAPASKAPASKAPASKGKAEATGKPGKTKKSKSIGSEENL